MKIRNLTIYKCPLLIVTSEIKINEKESKKRSIRNAPTEEKKEILVQPTISQYYFKELLTDEKIPVYRIQRIIGAPYQEDIIYHYPPNSPYFIQYEETIDNEEYRGNTLQKPSIEEIIKYLEENDVEQFKEELNQIIREANENFQRSKEKHIKSDQVILKQLLKKKKSR